MRVHVKQLPSPSHPSHHTDTNDNRGQPLRALRVQRRRFDRHAQPCAVDRCSGIRRMVRGICIGADTTATAVVTCGSSILGETSEATCPAANAVADPSQSVSATGGGSARAASL